MNKKTAIVVVLVAVVALSAFALYRSNSFNQARQNQPEEDNLAKTELEGVEENINAYDIEEDISITMRTEVDGEEGVMGLTQAQKLEMLDIIDPASNNTVLEEFNTHLPENINDAREYMLYEISYDYFLITAEEGTQIRENPDPNSPVLAELETLDKVSLLQRVEGEEMAGSNIWYRVFFIANEQFNEGYVISTTGTPRVFRFDAMETAINELREELNQGELHFISNYKFENGVPPQEGDIAVDEHGYRYYHSAPAYVEASTDADYRYVPDGMLLRILDDTGEFYHVDVPTFNNQFFVPKEYIDPDITLTQLNHVIIVDRNQQNQAAFEIADNALNLISYTLSTTGISGDFSFETSLGMYKAIAKRERFEYLESGTENIAGYAPYAIRFTGGAYIHGVPVAYEEVEGEKIDPGTVEYLHTIGTFPRSNMCVRNFTSHAEFIYNWMDTANGAVIVIE
ncbi:L,D-transpeptidase family protein [Natronospora cellulosivora (SeqCode)]